MRRHHSASSGGGDDNLYVYLPLNGDFVDQVTSEDYSTYFSSLEVYTWYNDPADSSRKCLKHSNGGRNKEFPVVFRKAINSTANYLIPANTPNYKTSNNFLPLLGKTAEFWWYPYAQSGKVYVLQNNDSLLSQTTYGLYGYDLYRQGTTLYIYAKGRLNNANKNQQYTFGTFTNGQWYRITVAYKDNGDSTYSSTYKMYNASGTLLFNSDTLGMPPVPHGESNSIITTTRLLTFFHSHFSYYNAGVNYYDYLKEFKIYDGIL